MINLTLKQLRYFEALAQFGHFGRAADHCAISQPALSMQIRDLEDGLGMALFERNARQLPLTGFGEAFAARAREILRLVEELEDMARASRTRLAGRLRIGVIPTIAPYLLPSLLGQLALTHAGLDIRVRESQTRALIRELAEGRLDTAIVALPVSEASLVEVPLFSEEFVLVRPLADAATPVPAGDALREMKLLLLEEGHCFRDQALAYCGVNSMFARGALDASSLSTLVQMVAAGLGVTLIPDMAVRVETQSTPVSVARLASPAPSRSIGMVWRKTTPLTSQLHRIAEVVRQSAENMRAHG